MNYRDIIVFDFETGSRNPAKTQPTQIAAIALHGRKLTVQPGGIFNSEIRPILNDDKAIEMGLDPVEDEALEITHKTRKELAKAPHLKTVWKKFGEFVKTLPVPTSMNLFRMTPLRGNAMMVFETRLVFTLVEMFFGGSGEIDSKAEGRDFTEIEGRMIKRVIISGLEDLQTSWRPVFPVQVNYSRSEVNPQFVSIVPHSEIVIVVTFDIEIGRAPMSITVCVPYSMIEPIRTKLNAGFQSEQDEKDNTWGNRFKQNLQKVNVEIVAKLGEMDISVRDFLNLQKDDVLYLEHEVKDPISIEVNGVEKFKGFQGVYKGRKAINVDELIYEPVVDDDMLS